MLMRLRASYSLLRDKAGIFCPPNMMVPLSGGNWPPISFNSVVLPIPEAHNGSHLADRYGQADIIKNYPVATGKSQVVDFNQIVCAHAGLSPLLILIRLCARS